LESSLLLRPLPGPFIGAFFFFQTESSALDFVLALHENHTDLSLVSLEYMDAAAARLMADRGAGFVVPADAFCIYIKAESRHDEFIYDWIPALEKLYDETATGNSLADYAVAGQTASEILAFRRLRHHVPAGINEQAQLLMAAGGGKVSSDWWVPLDKLKEQMAFLREGLSGFSCPVYVFGHIGNGHPHVNFLPGSSEERRRCFEFTCDCMRQAAAFGGGVCGEHGLGKLKTVALEIQWPAGKIDLMRDVKRRFDPYGLASPGNIFTKV
jgi:FAD/FMN-containing dehydrogenase